MVEIFPIGIVPETLELPGNNRVSILTIGGRLEHNATTIQCSGRLSDGSEVTTPSVLFLMQGTYHTFVLLQHYYILQGLLFGLLARFKEFDCVINILVRTCCQ